MKRIDWEKYVLLFSISFSSFILYSFASDGAFDIWKGSEVVKEEGMSPQEFASSEGLLNEVASLLEEKIEIENIPPIENVNFEQIAAILEDGASVEAQVEVEENEDKETPNLQSAIRMTMDSFPSVLISEAQAESFRHLQSKEWGGYLPTVDVSLNRGLERSKSPTLRASTFDKRDMIREENTLTVRQMIFDGRAVSNRVKSATNLSHRAEANLQVTKETTGLKVIDVYLNVLRSKELIDIAREKVTQHQGILNTVEEREKKGVGRSSDTDQVSGRLALAKAQVERYRAGLANALSSYEAVVGVKPARLAVVSLQEVNKRLPDTLEYAALSAKEKHSVLKQAVYDLASAKADVQEAKAAFWPQLHFQFDASDSSDLDGIEGKSNDMQAKLVLSFNIFNGMTDLEEKKSRAALLREKSYSSDLAKRNILKDVHIAWNFLESSKQDFRYFTDHRNASLSAFNAYQEQYMIAKRTLIDLLNSADELSQAQESAVNARYTTILRGYELLYAMGDLLGDMGVEDEDSSMAALSEEQIIEVSQ
ncbi:MAG: adhesin transport system outer membrane protein [Chlamydiales bacterium]|jgi:adhesin transport system outer membrane protein